MTPNVIYKFHRSVAAIALPADPRLVSHPHNLSFLGCLEKEIFDFFDSKKPGSKCVCFPLVSWS